jgi:two-component system nitrate/nitrite sensor histidine kinase NarX
MDKDSVSPLFRRVSLLRWLFIIFSVLLILSHQVIEYTRLHEIIHLEYFEAFYIIVGSVLIWWAMTSLRNRIGATEAAEAALHEAHAALRKANERLTFLIEVNHRLAQAQDEESLISIVLQLPREVVPAVATSLVFFDQHQLRPPTIYHGTVEPSLLKAWTAHLAAAEIRQQCVSCSVRSATSPKHCFMFTSTLASLGVQKIHCVPLKSNGREHSVLNIYLADEEHPTAQEQSLLEALAHEISLALESQQLRSRELAMLTHIQRARRVSNLHNELAQTLRHMIEALGIHGGVLFLSEMETDELQLEVEVGEPLDTTMGLIKGVAHDAWLTEKPIVIREFVQVADTNIGSLLAVPVRTPEQSLGSLVLWATRSDAFIPRRVQLVATVAGQAALLVANQRLYLQGEYRAALAERSRLAREIHDGLAQSLGYLKLRTAQITDWLKHGDTTHTLMGLAEVQELLDKAYVETREAIDGLQMTAQTTNLQQWFSEMIAEFRVMTGIEVTADPVPDIAVPPEVQAQLQRIVLEAFNNIRKHASASRVYLEWHLEDDWLTLKISDDGRGFDPDDVPPIARHGLRIMHERAGLLGADFWVNGHTGEGAQVTLKLPLGQTAEEVHNE